MYTKKKLSMWRYLPKLSSVSSTYGMLWPILVFPKKFSRKAAIQPIVRKIRYLNWSFVNEYIGDITISTQFIKNKQCYCRQISQSDCSIHIQLNYLRISTGIVRGWLFSSPDPKGHVSYCHHLASVVRRKLFQKSSPLKVLDQWKPNFVWIITMVSSFKIVSSDAVHQPTWPLLLKIEHMVKLQVLGNNSKTVNNIKNLTRLKMISTSRSTYPAILK
jgi:hypothetical protein